jgi:hypothetical protein
VRPGFKSARAQLVTDLRKKGQHHQANMFAHQVGCAQHDSQEALHQLVDAKYTRPERFDGLCSSCAWAVQLVARCATQLCALMFACAGPACWVATAQGWWWRGPKQVWVCTPVCGQGHRAPGRGWWWGWPWWGGRRRPAWCWWRGGPAVSQDAADAGRCALLTTH